MMISGAGIPFPVEVKVLKDYKPQTRLALTWAQTADGSYVAQDRGPATDTYETEFRVYGYYDAINNLVDALHGNRAAGNHVLTLSRFASDEYIFGADVIHEAVDMTATVLDFGTVVQGTWGGYGINLRLRSLSPGLVGTATLPDLQYMDFRHVSDSTVSVNKYDTYHGSFTYADRRKDAGRIEGVFTFSKDDMKNMRCFLRETRGKSFTVTGINGIRFPWGPRRSAWPATCRCTDWEDLGIWGEQFWKMRVVLREVRTL